MLRSAFSRMVALAERFFSWNLAVWNSEMLRTRASTALQQIARLRRREFEFRRGMRSSESELAESGPLESAMRRKLKENFNPTELTISNDSSQHSHHTAMRERGGGNGETHFSIAIVSDAFHDKKMMQRHRMIYSALSEEFEAGLHALSLHVKTPEEIEQKELANV